SPPTMAHLIASLGLKRGPKNVDTIRPIKKPPKKSNRIKNTARPGVINIVVSLLGMNEPLAVLAPSATRPALSAVDHKEPQSVPESDSTVHLRLDRRHYKKRRYWPSRS